MSSPHDISVSHGIVLILLSAPLFLFVLVAAPLHARNAQIKRFTHIEKFICVKCTHTRLTPYESFPTPFHFSILLQNSGFEE